MNTALLSLIALAFGQNPPPADPAAQLAERTEQLKVFKEKAAELELRRGPEQPPLALTKEPVLRYSNAEREIGSLDGATFVWLEGARPLAVASFSIRRQGNSIYRECTSLSPWPLACTSGGAGVWLPKKGGLLAQSLSDAPLPGDTKAQRLTQLRALARRFTATCYNSRTEEPTELRLLPQPLYRYDDERSGILDGGLFAFVVSNDPELLLVLEAAKTEAGAAWRYSLARMSSLKESVRLDGKEIWAVPNYYRDPSEDRRTGPYVESRIGTFGPPAAAPPAPK
jgi:hypothetical protein